MGEHNKRLHQTKPVSLAVLTHVSRQLALQVKPMLGRPYGTIDHIEGVVMKLSILVFGLVALMGVGPNSAKSLVCNDNTILGLEISGEPLAPTWIINQVAQDVMMIRITYPEVAEITVTPDWIPGEVIVGLTEDAWLDYQAGSFAAIDSLNTLIGVATIQEIQTSSALLLTMDECYHPVFLVGEYAGLEGVRYAVPNIILAEGDDISSTQVGHYTFKHGYGDCPSGCLYEHYWEFHVDGGTVNLVDEYIYDSSVAGVHDSPSVGSVDGFEVWPNPLNPSTSIRFSLGESGPVSVRVYDVGGRLVRDLVSEVFAAGEHVIQWSGKSNSGLVVSSGLYFCTLEGSGWARTKKVVVLK